MTREQLLDALEQLYTKVQASLPQVEGNPCGSCKACCTATGMSHHRVAELELEWMQSRLGAPAVDRFRAYLERVADPEGGLLYPTCPNYREATPEQAGGCGVYAERPFSCRVFGHYRATGSAYPVDCVFDASTAEFSPGRYFATVPRTDRLRWLIREFQLLSGPARTGAVAAHEAAAIAVEVDPEYLNLEDPIDRSIVHHLNGDLEGALRELLEARALPERSNYVDYSLAMIYSMLDQHEPAILHYRRAAEQVPRADFYFYAGYHSLALGRGEEGRSELLRAVELDPNYSLALGFLGYLATQEQRWPEAEHYLSRAVQADPSNGIFHFRLGTVYLQLGERETGLSCLRRAEQFEASAAMAREFLAQLG